MRILHLTLDSKSDPDSHVFATMEHMQSFTFKVPFTIEYPSRCIRFAEQNEVISWNSNPWMSPLKAMKWNHINFCKLHWEIRHPITLCVAELLAIKRTWFNCYQLRGSGFEQSQPPRSGERFLTSSTQCYKLQLHRNGWSEFLYHAD